jgi:spore germination protein YaaH
MSDCAFCEIIPFKANNTPVWIITDTNTNIHNDSIYKEAIYIQRKTISETEFKYCTDFTPKARITLTQKEASELLTHSEIWKQIKAEHAIIFTEIANITDTQLANKLENLKLPKDWDIILLTNNQDIQYVLTKRAAHILLASSRQFHNNLKTFIESIQGLRIVKI